ncbi:hypothetical protein AYI69_g9156 [Smittium culicis]|uniref:Uncharacterized protein n=1 Tax=Smittium culicis TaxID=133412 RepID=A0A1R1XEL2_9FUNG|nr:hypothetical protein AYI69_g9156 [Smittium culicis]
MRNTLYTKRKFSLEKYLNKKLPNWNIDLGGDSNEENISSKKTSSLIRRLTAGKWRSKSTSNVKKSNSSIFPTKNKIISILKSDVDENNFSDEYNNKLEKIENDLKQRKKTIGSDDILITLDQIEKTRPEGLDGGNNKAKNYQNIFHKDIQIKSEAPKKSINNEYSGVLKPRITNSSSHLSMTSVISSKLSDDGSSIFHINDLEFNGEPDKKFDNLESSKLPSTRVSNSDCENEKSQEFTLFSKELPETPLYSIDKDDSITRNNDPVRHQKIKRDSNSSNILLNPAKSAHSEKIDSLKSRIEGLNKDTKKNHIIYSELNRELVDAKLSGSGWVYKTLIEHIYHFETATKAKRRSNNAYNTNDLPFPTLSNIYDYKFYQPLNENSTKNSKSLSMFDDDFSEFSYIQRNGGENSRIENSKIRRTNSNEIRHVNRIDLRKSQLEYNSEPNLVRKISIIKLNKDPKAVNYSTKVQSNEMMNIRLSSSNKIELKSEIKICLDGLVELPDLKNQPLLTRKHSSTKTPNKEGKIPQKRSFLLLPQTENSVENSKSFNNFVGPKIVKRTSYNKKSGLMIPKSRISSSSYSNKSIYSNDQINNSNTHQIMGQNSFETESKPDYTKLKSNNCEIKKHMDMVFPKLKTILESKPDLYKTLIVSLKENESLLKLIIYLSTKKTQIISILKPKGSETNIGIDQPLEYNEFNLPSLSKSQIAKLKKMGLITVQVSCVNDDTTETSDKVTNKNKKSKETKSRVYDNESDSSISYGFSSSDFSDSDISSEDVSNKENEKSLHSMVNTYRLQTPLESCDNFSDSTV